MAPDEPHEPQTTSMTCLGERGQYVVSWTGAGMQVRDRFYEVNESHQYAKTGAWVARAQPSLVAIPPCSVVPTPAWNSGTARKRSLTIAGEALRSGAAPAAPFWNARVPNCHGELK